MYEDTDFTDRQVLDDYKVRVGSEACRATIALVNSDASVEQGIEGELWVKKLEQRS